MADLFVVRRPISDAAARVEALDPHRSFLVEAPAGSGKTALLIQRFLTLLAEPGVSMPNEVLAITFTRDATAELRDRVLRQLQMAAAGVVPEDDFDRLVRPLAEAVVERDRTLGWHLLEYPRRLNIQTIDAVCAEIAHSLPVLAGSGANLSPAAEPEPLYLEAARRTLMLLGGQDERLSAALQNILLHRDANLDDTKTLIADMLSLRDQWAGLVPLQPEELTDEALDKQVLPRLQLALERAICTALTALSRVLPPSMLEELCRFAAELGRADGYNGSPSPIAICAGRQEISAERSEHLEHWRALVHLLLTKDGDFRKERGLTSRNVAFTLETHHKKELAALIDQVSADEPIRHALLAVRALPPAVYPAEQWTITKALFRVLSHALAELQLVFAERSACDFTELSLLARSALRKDEDGSDLALSTGARLQHLLVDEMQDTSTGQYELIQLLTRRWDGYTQTVFLVGDPKQSIYLFREARVERFLHTLHTKHLGEVPLTVLRLTANFRSQSLLVDAFNEDFALVFPPVPERGLPAKPEAVAYLAASAIRPASEPDPRHWHTTILPDKRAANDEADRQARSMRAIIEQWRARPLPGRRTKPWKIAVLVRGRKHLAPIVAALREGPSPVPFRAVNIEPLGERQEILDLLALTRALLHPADRTAWLALLRSPLCGLSLDALHRISGSDDPALFPRPLLGLITDGSFSLSLEDAAILGRFRTILIAALKQRGTMRLSEWVHRTWNSFGSAGFLTADENNNVQRFLELLDGLSASPGEADDQVDLVLLMTRLDKLYANPSSAPDAVELMTIHNAKGLEWDVVLVPALERRAGADQARLLSWIELEGVSEEEDDRAAHGLLAPIQARGEDAALLNRWMRSVQSAREQAEISRLFYVACTRAKEELHLYSATTLKKSGELSVPSGSLLSAALPAASAHFQPAATAEVIFFTDIEAPVYEVGFLDRLAASEPVRTLQRIPLSAAPAPVSVADSSAAPLFFRPSGGYPVRVFGNTVHTFLEQITGEIAAGARPEDILPLLNQRSPRIHAVLRAAGLPQSECDRLIPQVTRALRNTLTDPAGRWILSAHAQADTERTLRQAGITLRPDRTFLAGPDALSFGESHLWIVDYKTAAAGGRDSERFLAEERVKYAAQLQTYAAALQGERPVRTALYYVSIPALIAMETIVDPAIKIKADSSAFATE